jgi:ribonuclease HI
MPPDAPQAGAAPGSQRKPPAGPARPEHLIVYVDGASSGNPGPAGAGAVVKDDDGTTLLEKARAFGPATNNVAEYQSLLLGLELAATLRPRHLTIRSDSELMVRQVAGQYRVKAPHLKPLLAQARRLLAPFDSVEIQHIPREKNTEADALSRKALEKARAVDAELPPDARKSPASAKAFRLK